MGGLVYGLYFGLKPCLEFFQRPETVGDFVLLGFVHFGIAVDISDGEWKKGRDVRLALVLEYRIPAYECKHCLKGEVKIGFLPKFAGPLAGTILPWTLSAASEGDGREGFSHLCVLGK